MVLKCIGISEEHVINAAAPGTSDVHFCEHACACVSLHVTNDNAMYSIRRGHFIQNVTLLPSTHREAPVVEMPSFDIKMDL